MLFLGITIGILAGVFVMGLASSAKTADIRMEKINAIAKIEEEMNFLKNSQGTYDEGVAKGLEIALKIIKGE